MLSRAILDAVIRSPAEQVMRYRLEYRQELLRDLRLESCARQDRWRQPDRSGKYAPPGLRWCRPPEPAARHAVHYRMRQLLQKVRALILLGPLPIPDFNQPAEVHFQNQISTCCRPTVSCHRTCSCPKTAADSEAPSAAERSAKPGARCTVPLARHCSFACSCS